MITAVSRGETNTRERDWADMWRLTGIHELDGDEMTQAARATARYREVPLRPLSDQLGGLVAARAGSYRTWRRKQGPDAEAYPAELETVVAGVVTFGDPLLTGDAEGKCWLPSQRCWTQQPTHSA
jgi:hypothetical protein